MRVTCAASGRASLPRVWPQSAKHRQGRPQTMKATLARNSAGARGAPPAMGKSSTRYTAATQPSVTRAASRRGAHQKRSWLKSESANNTPPSANTTHRASRAQVQYGEKASQESPRAVKLAGVSSHKSPRLRCWALRPPKGAARRSSARKIELLEAHVVRGGIAQHLPLAVCERAYLLRRAAPVQVPGLEPLAGARQGSRPQKHIALHHRPVHDDGTHAD